MVSACISFAAFARSRPTKHGVTNPGFPPHGWQHSASLSLSFSPCKGKGFTVCGGGLVAFQHTIQQVTILCASSGSRSYKPLCAPIFSFAHRIPVPLPSENRIGKQSSWVGGGERGKGGTYTCASCGVSEAYRAIAKHPRWLWGGFSQSG